MKYVRLLSVAAAMLAVPFVAKANSFTDARYSVGPEDVELMIDSKEALGAPEVDTGSGYVRVAFHGMTDPGRITKRGDGQAVDAIRFVPSSRQHDTGLVVFQLSDRRRLADSTVRVDRVGSSTRIRIARAALAPISQPGVTISPLTPASTATPTPATAAPASSTNSTAAARPATAPASASAASHRSSSLFPAATKQKANSEATTASSPALFASTTSSSGPGMGTILIITSLLALVYGAVRYFMKRKGPIAKMPGIEIVASRRLGPRHQLVLVRALGKDHLLSIHGGETRRIASLRSSLEFGDDEADGSFEPMLRLRAAKPALDSEPPPAPVAKKVETKRQDTSFPPEGRFGPDMLRLVTPSLAAVGGASEGVTTSVSTAATTAIGAGKTVAPLASVAGLIRLRDKARK